MLALNYEFLKSLRFYFFFPCHVRCTTTAITTDAKTVCCVRTVLCSTRRLSSANGGTMSSVINLSTFLCSTRTYTGLVCKQRFVYFIIPYSSIFLPVGAVAQSVKRMLPDGGVPGSSPGPTLALIPNFEC